MKTWRDFCHSSECRCCMCVATWSKGWWTPSSSTESRRTRHRCFRPRMLVLLKVVWKYPNDSSEFTHRIVARTALRCKWDPKRWSQAIAILDSPAAQSSVFVIELKAHQSPNQIARFQLTQRGQENTKSGIVWHVRRLSCNCITNEVSLILTVNLKIFNLHYWSHGKHNQSRHLFAV